MNSTEKIRIDKWLKVARFYKQRSAAADAVENGWIKLNEERVRPSKLIGIGDQLLIRMGSDYRKCTVLGITHRSLPASEARKLYDLEGPTLPDTPMADFLEIWQAQDKENQKLWREKPDKKQRREINRQKYGEN